MNFNGANTRSSGGHERREDTSVLESGEDLGLGISAVMVIMLLSSLSLAILLGFAMNDNSNLILKVLFVVDGNGGREHGILREAHHHGLSIKTHHHRLTKLAHHRHKSRHGVGFRDVQFLHKIA